MGASSSLIGCLCWVSLLCCIWRGSLLDGLCWVALFGGLVGCPCWGLVGCPWWVGPWWVALVGGLCWVSFAGCPCWVSFVGSPYCVLVGWPYRVFLLGVLVGWPYCVLVGSPYWVSFVVGSLLGVLCCGWVGSPYWVTLMCPYWVWVGFRCRVHPNPTCICAATLERLYWRHIRHPILYIVLYMIFAWK